MALGIWGLEPRGSLRRAEGGKGAQVSPPPPQSPSWLRRCPRQFPHMELGIPVAGKPRQQAALPAPLTKSGMGDVAGGVSAGAHISGGFSSERGAPLPRCWFPLGVPLSHPGGLSPECPSQHHTRHVPAECSGIPGALTTCLLLQGILHHRGQVDHQHRGCRELVELGAERVHPHPLHCHYGGLHKVGGLGWEAGTSRGIGVTCERGRETHTHTT